MDSYTVEDCLNNSINAHLAMVEARRSGHYDQSIIKELQEAEIYWAKRAEQSRELRRNIIDILSSYRAARDDII